MIPVYVYALLDDLRVIKICKAASSTLLRSKANIWVQFLQFLYILIVPFLQFLYIIRHLQLQTRHQFKTVVNDKKLCHMLFHFQLMQENITGLLRPVGKTQPTRKKQ